MEAPRFVTREDLPGFLTTLFERSPDGWLLVDSVGTIHIANVAARAILAVDGSGLEGTSIETWMPDRRLDEPASDSDTMMISAQGDHFPAEIDIVPLPNTEGCHWIVFRDITLRKGFEGSVRHHAEELERMVRARKSEFDDLRDRYRRLYDLVPVFDFELDSQNNIASVNRKACLALGVTTDRLIGLPLSDLAVPDRKQDLAAALARMRDGSYTPFETRLRGTDGTRIDIVLYAALESSAPRSAMRVVGLDITARREAEQLVDQSLDLAEAQRARMERILRGIGEGVVVTDPDGQVRLMNPIAERLLDIDEQFAFGRNLFGEQRDVEFARTWSEFVDSTEDLAVTELRFHSSSDRVFTVTLSRIRTSEGKPAGCVGVLRDVTEERDVERMKRDLVTGITQELRAPIASIRGCTATALRSGTAGEEDRARALETVEKEAARLQHLVEGLLTVSSLEAGREALDLQPGDFTAVLHDAHEAFAPVAREKGVHLEIATENRNGAGIFDPQRMRRVLDNLIDNAIRFTPAGGRVILEFSRNGETILCSVSDTGPGIAPDRLAHIFDCFYRSPSASTRSSRSGLGLHIVQRLVELHDGAISAESRLGGGTAFRFHFPAVPHVREASGVQVAPARPDFEPLPPGHDITTTAADVPPLSPEDPLLDDPGDEETPELRVARPSSARD